MVFSSSSGQHAAQADNRSTRILVLFAVALFGASCNAASAGRGVRFEVSFPSSVRAEPVTGRAYILITRDRDSRAITQRSFGHQPVLSRTGEPFFAVDVENLAPGAAAVIDASAIGYPVATLSEMPAGDYFAQAVMNIYTEFHRADGRKIWAHMDQWEGQHFNWSPGNLLSEVQQVRISNDNSTTYRLELTSEIPPVEIPPDTPAVQRIKIQSERLSEFWGRPIYLGATVLLPKGYWDDDALYPTIYVQGHFSLDPPFGYTTEPAPESEQAASARKRRGVETGYEFQQSWNSEGFPRFIAVTLQHPTPYFDDSYLVNSANNGPYQDAVTHELIPELEKRFRLIPKGYARLLTGGSTGGYEALAAQVHQPEFYGGAWVFYPDPIDFRSLFLINIYEDENAFRAPGYEWLAPERYAFRAADGQPLQSIRQLSRLHDALGSRGRSGEYLEAWEAAFGPVGSDGYPRPLWDRKTGGIDREVAGYWRDQGYDLRHYLQENWNRIGPALVGKLHLFCGDMDNYYFNLPVYFLEDFLTRTTKPYYAGSFSYGRPLKDHGWHPMNNADMLRQMARHIEKYRPAGEPASPRVPGRR
ncbi:MAG: hypothetical protein KF868_10750 [Acidobacteria bacterium]|nr:hypothetical protein [Acidobacteriota bacterium]